MEDPVGLLAAHPTADTQNLEHPITTSSISVEVMNVDTAVVPIMPQSVENPVSEKSAESALAVQPETDVLLPATSASFVSAAAISPYPKVSEAVVGRRRQSVTGGSSTVLTESPYKNQLEQSLANKKRTRKETQKTPRKANLSKKRKKSLEVEFDEPSVASAENRIKNKGKAAKTKALKIKKSAKSKMDKSRPTQHQQDNCKCNGCNAQFGDVSDPKKTEEWIECCKCNAWFHETCAEECGLMDDDVFWCKNCV